MSTAYSECVSVVCSLVVVEKQRVLNIVSVCVCSLRYPACNAHAPRCHLWPVPLYNIFADYLIKGTNRDKKVTVHKMSFDSLYNFFLFEKFPSLKNLPKITHKNSNKRITMRNNFIHLRSRLNMVIYIYIGRHLKYPLFLSDLMNLELARRIFEEHSNIKFHETPSSERRVVPCDRTGG